MSTFLSYLSWVIKMLNVYYIFYFYYFFFQAEDGIRDRDVTGVQTCALPSACSNQEAVANNSATDLGPPKPRSSLVGTVKIKIRFW